LTGPDLATMLDRMSDQDSEDVKAKYREALERKNKKTSDAVSGGKQGEAVHGGTDTHAHGGRRQFRRKSG
jgi:hypothetical protein